MLIKKSLRGLIIVTIILVLIGGYVYSSRSPYIAIRKHLLTVDPLKAVECGITPTAIYSFQKGTPYIISGFEEYGIYVVHIKANKFKLYYVYSMGTL